MKKEKKIKSEVSAIVKTAIKKAMRRPPRDKMIRTGTTSTK
jgi:hypothetical protein